MSIQHTSSAANAFAAPQSAFSFPTIPGWAEGAIQLWQDARQRCGAGARCPTCKRSSRTFWQHSDGQIFAAGGFLYCIVAKIPERPVGTDDLLLCSVCGPVARHPDGQTRRVELIGPSVTVDAPESVTVSISPEGEAEVVEHCGQGGAR